MNEEILKPYVRSVTEEDRKTLPKFSHSKLECFENCQYNYLKKYIEGKTTSDTTIALQSGTLAHLLLEFKGKALVEGNPVDYEYLAQVLQNGFDEETEKSKEHIAGLNELKKQYWETYSAPDSEGRTYDQKWELFDKVLHDEMETDKWRPVALEMPFEFVWNDKAIIHGFIDRVDEYEGRYRVVDYKTSKKTFSDSKTKTSQQMSIYSCAILNEFGKLPEQFLYRFVFLNDQQYANSKGWEKRFIKKMDKVFSQIDECNKTGIYTPSPCPLCHWCPYSLTNPDAHDFKYECDYYSLWTPTNKTFEVNKVWENNESGKANNTNLNNNEKRKLIF